MGHVGPEVTLDDPALVHETAYLYGKVWIGPGASVWPYVVTRAEMHEIRIGARTNLQDHVMVHVGYSTPTIVGEDCSITHRVVLHGCEIGDRCLIGIGATVMDGAKIGANSIVAGHSIVTEGTEFPANSVIAGAPAKLVRERDCGAANLVNATFYHQNAMKYAAGEDRWPEAEIKGLFGRQGAYLDRRPVRSARAAHGPPQGRALGCAACTAAVFRNFAIKRTRFGGSERTTRAVSGPHRAAQATSGGVRVLA